MDSRDSSMQQSNATLCKNGCGFYSNAGNEGLCSVCYKDIVKKKQAPPTNMPASFSEFSTFTPPLISFFPLFLTEKHVLKHVYFQISEKTSFLR